MFASISHNLRKPLHFKGADSRALFWPFAILIFVLFYAAIAALFLARVGPAMADMLRNQTAPDPAAVFEAMPITGFVAIAITAVALLAASVTRRLNDRGKPVWWALLPLFLSVASNYLSMRNATEMFRDGPVFGPLYMAAMMANLLAWISIIYLIVLLATRRQGSFPA